jgi:hypothetical protein
MPAVFQNGNVRSRCPDCKAITTFEFREAGPHEFGTITVDHHARPQVAYKLLRCAGCSRAGVAKVTHDRNYANGEMEWFWPKAVAVLELPAGAPKGVIMEYAEAQLCLSSSAWRAAAAMLRSALEKTLLENGYNEPNLYKQIEAAAADGAITSARRQKAQDLVRTLGNDVLHEPWRPVTQEEADLANHYVGRVVEDFYDDRPTVEALLRAKGRIT